MGGQNGRKVQEVHRQDAQLDGERPGVYRQRFQAKRLRRSFSYWPLGERRGCLGEQDPFGKVRSEMHRVTGGLLSA
jgi:hypothetical protein